MAFPCFWVAVFPKVPDAGPIQGYGLAATVAGFTPCLAFAHGVLLSCFGLVNGPILEPIARLQRLAINRLLCPASLPDSVDAIDL